ncbi:NAD(+) diphosphatase [Microbacterium neungamense]|uniref:NAD(+) diphosphatase n=1 Tax=Microbacterium neungamense TaxID=2810535 RepID=UPI00217E7405|nr:NAD(+) diphosphatase [Microbacterium neungamense]UWF78152.1 NAD(+) diphosphatase [Microbacterium neungamense]
MTDAPMTLDRAAELRDEPGVLERLRGDARSRTIVVREGRLRVHDDALLRSPAAEIVDAEAAEWALLGRDRDGAPLLLAAVPPIEDSLDAAPEEMWLGVREVAPRLGTHDQQLLLGAVALAGWLRDARFCPRCGTAAELRQGGWSRRCPGCGAEHFPRTDPAVIVAVESPDGERLLLGANTRWGGRMHSCFAGFAEAGESLEATIHRELAEEAGVRIAGIRYLSSQAWPYPRSLMIGFRAVAADEDVRADGEEILEVRWLSRAEIGSALAGEGPVGLPGEASIARALIQDWYEERGGAASGRGRPQGGAPDAPAPSERSVSS